MSAPEPSDEELARRARRGDASAYDRLVRRHLRPAMALAWQSTRHHHDAEDLVQEAFHRAVRALPSYDPRRPFAPWFYAIVRNVARTAHRQRARRAALHPAGDREQEAGDGPRVAAESVASTGEVERAIAELPAMQRAALRLCEIEGFTSAEAGVMLGISEGTVRTHLHRAKRRLRERLASAVPAGDAADLSAPIPDPPGRTLP